MYLWQRLAAVSWWSHHQDQIRSDGGNDLAIIERPGRKRFVLEISCRTRVRAERLRRRFGGRVVRLPPDWLARFARAQKTKPLRIAQRLVISNVGGTRQSRRQGRSHIVIPAGAAFGTGQHPTTAMSLRMLEDLTRQWKPGWSIVDLGTGSGIFALAAKCLGARRVIAIDIDPVAISTAKANATLNRIKRIQFKVADVRTWHIPTGLSVVTANLFSELLIEILPKLKRVPRVIVSGIMREQERAVRRALKQNGFALQTVHRRGKWIAAVATCAQFKERRFSNRRTSSEFGDGNRH